MKKTDPYQIATIILSIAIVISIGVFIYNLTRGTFGKAALNVSVTSGNASVIVDGKDKGETPVYTEELKAGDIKVEINGETNSYSTIIKPAAGTLAIIKRNLGVTETFSSGQNIWFVKSGTEEPTISVISPGNDGVSVIVDGVEMGKTPVRFAIKDLLNQNDEGKYKLSFKKDGYQDQEVDIKARTQYELNIRVDMFLKPIPTEITTLTGLPDGIDFINLSSIANNSFSDRQGWAKAVNFWLSATGAAVFGNSKVEKFDYFLDDAGKIYNSDGNEVQPGEMDLSSAKYIGYLGESTAEGLTDSANDSLSIALGKKVTSSISGGALGSIEILTTGIGYLKVRSDPSTSGAQLGTADVGSQFAVLEEKNGWYKIEYETGKEGWVSGTYAKKL